MPLSFPSGRSSVLAAEGRLPAGGLCPPVSAHRRQVAGPSAVRGAARRPAAVEAETLEIASGVAGVAGEHGDVDAELADGALRSEEHTSELHSLMRISYDVFCLKKKKTNNRT